MTTARLILLGASNVALGLPLVVETARQALGAERLEVFAAVGCGRSYGQRSNLLVRGLPGILESGLWPALAESPRAPVYALLADLGNDVAYGVEIPVLAGWVEECLRRLARYEARTILALPPTAGLLRLPAWRIALSRRLFFPRSTVTVDMVRDRVRELDGRLREIASRWGLDQVEARPEWYGIDPIHFRSSRWSQAWGAIFAPWTPAGEPRNVPLRRWLLLLRMAPERWWLFGRERRRRQPAGTLPGGVLLSLY